MSSNLGAGRPRVDIKIVDASIILANNLNGFICVQGATTKGEPYVPIFVPNFDTFVEEFGGLTEEQDFPLYCKRALENGAKLYVSRVAHWDGADWEGTKATVDIVDGPNTLTVDAKYVGAGYDGLTITIAQSLSGNASTVDITETQARYSKTLSDFPLVTSPEDLAILNQFLKFTETSALPATMPIGVGTLTGGAQDLLQIVDADYIGDNSTETKGWFAFDEVLDASRIFNFDRAVAAVDVALQLYVENRQDMRFFIRPTIADNEDYTTMISYRQGGNIDSYWGALIAGNIIVTDPLNTDVIKDISAIGDVAGLMAKKDVETGEWATSAGPNRGVLKAVNGVTYNLGSPSNKDFFDQAYQQQINPVINDKQFGVVYWGNRSLLKDQTKLLKFDNVADLTVFIKNSLLPLIRSVLFEPNSPDSWNLIYRKVKPFIKNVLEANGAIRAGENVNWFWEGDQNATSLDDLNYNTKADIDQGIYRVRFIYQPVVAMEYIGVELTLTDSTTIAELVEVQV